ncbi:hypothetical protein TrLO_g9209 [Triparma laevis f. longispina]|uniref:Cytosol aminopeptidase domain-containing protein n=2 Tax=Triparma laevis TaxID=1534972 RepID=A0A9W7KVH4_9STRA|nr:hypothetical protein TrLO_g9209 [Triparma laevis f. longispina]
MKFHTNALSLLLLTQPLSAFSFTSLARVPPVLTTGFRRLSTTAVRSSSSILQFNPPSENDTADVQKISTADVQKIIGRHDLLEKLDDSVLASTGVDSTIFKALLSTLSPKSGGTASTLYSSSHKTLYIHSLPTSSLSRHNTPLRSSDITKLVSPKSPKGTEVVDLTFVAENVKDASAIASAAAKSFPVFKCTKKSDDPEEKKEVKHNVRFATTSALLSCKNIYKNAQTTSNAITLASRLVDTPPNMLNVSEFITEASQVAQRLKNHNVKFEVIRGEDLKKKGYGGIYNVGKAADDPPALVVLTKKWNQEGEKVSLVGKGIVYDTGGLSLKVGGGMVGMKSDCGGAAGLLAGFEGVVECGTEEPLRELQLILCLAENSIGPSAFRNDDIITFKSGRTCEINNTDAEGRLVLADGVAHATMCDDKPDLVVDMATLTGAQMVATGKHFAGIVTNSAEAEARCVEAGVRSGDLVHPLPYAPEFFNSEFSSKVADSKNSVKNRMNAQTSCAGQFVGNNVDQKWLEEGGQWLHVDMAGPSTFDGGRGSGFGVGLIMALLKAKGFA